MFVVLLAQAAMAMPAPAACVTPAPLPAAYAGFGAAQPVTAAASVAASAAATLTIGRGAVATLLPASALTLPVALQRPLAGTQHGGLFAFTVATAGRYRVALGRAVWIDVVANGAALPSVAHQHGPDCTGVRKVVDWDLAPGRYLLQVAGDDQPTVALAVLRAS